MLLLGACLYDGWYQRSTPQFVQNASSDAKAAPHLPQWVPIAGGGWVVLVSMIELLRIFRMVPIIRNLIIKKSAARIINRMTNSGIPNGPTLILPSFLRRILCVL